MLRDIRFLLKSHYSDSRALLVGINDYEHVSPLAYAVSDATTVRDVLVQDLRFPSANVVLLTNGEATKAEIMRAYLRLASPDIGLDERVVFFFAGHGDTRTGIRGEVGYLVPFDADPNDLSTFIKWDELTGNSELIRAKHMLFIMDACYGGLALTRSSTGNTRFLKDMMLRYSRQVLTAGKADETVSDSGGPLPDHSVFTGHLVEGMRGSAVAEDGVLTATGLMSYVYGKVAGDKNSRQTPHYGHFDGDGDLILIAPQLDEPDNDTRDLDTLIALPPLEEELSTRSTGLKIDRAKALLSNSGSSIELHDFVMDEVKRFLAQTSEDYFAARGEFSVEALTERIAKYEDVVGDLDAILACIAYWALPSHRNVLRKALARSTDRLDPQSGSSIWLELRRYPLILELYAAGIAAVHGERYDSLADIFYSPVEETDRRRDAECFLGIASNAVLELARQKVFQKLPGHEKHFAPMSEYLFKIMQPTIDETLFLGKGYERAFDEFEVLLGLAVADLLNVKTGHIWGPVGRFGWKEHQGNAPLKRTIEEARAAGSDWAPLRGGLFDGKIERVEAVAGEFYEGVSRLSWW